MRNAQAKRFRRGVRHGERLFAERLERRDLLSVSIARTSLNLRFSAHVEGPEVAFGEYQTFRITNGGPASLSNVWVKATNFAPAQKVQLGSGEDGLYFLGDLGVGSANAETAFIYMVATQVTKPPAFDPQNYTIEVWQGVPGTPGSSLIASQNDLFQWVAEANADDSSARTNSVTVNYAYGGSPTAGPIVGGTMTMTVTGDIKNKPDRILFTPASTIDWPADAFVLEDAVVTYSKGPQLPPDVIFEKPIISKPKDFVVVYTFHVAGTTSSPTPVTPVQYTANGPQDLQSRKFDHSPVLHDVPPIPPATFSATADLAIQKDDFVQRYAPGETITWQITVTNAGPNAVTGARVQDAFPSQVGAASWTAVFTGGSGTTSGSGNLDQLVNLNAGGTAVYTVVATTLSTATGNLSNTATVTPPANAIDPNLSNNTSTHVDLFAPVADLAITKVDGSPTYVPGKTTTYTVTVTNNGPSFVTAARVVDTLPAAFTSLSWTATFTGSGSSGATSGSGSINELIDLAAGGTATYMILATVSPTATAAITNTATVTPPANTTDPNLANNTASDTNTATPEVFLVVAKTDGSATYVPGLATAYTVTVRNDGPSFLDNGRLVDLLPAAISGAAWSASYTGAGSGGATNGSGNVDATFDLAVGGTATFTITAPVVPTATGNLVNTATVSVPPGTTNTNPVTTATDTDTPAPSADLRAAKTDGVSQYVPGTTTTYTITITNAGVSAVFGATVTDTLPPQIDPASPWSAVFTNGSGATSGVGSIAESVNLGVGGFVVYTVTAAILPSATGNLVNTVTVAPPLGTTDPNPTNNTATDIDTLDPSVDLVILKRDETTTYTPGTIQAFTITVTNASNVAVTGARVQDAFPVQVDPAGITWLAVFTNGSGTTSGSGDLDELISLDAGGFVVYSISAATLSTATGTMSNTATVTPPEGVPDPNPDNNTSTHVDAPEPVADLAIEKTDPSPTYVPGETTTYTVTVTNAGPSYVTAARVVDTFSSAFTAIAWTAVFAGEGSSGTTSGSGSIDELVNLAVGGSATYTIVATVASTATTDIANTASVTPPGNTTDPNLANNAATHTNTAAPAVFLVISKSDSTGTYVPGETLNYLITVTNTGPSFLNDGWLVDLFPNSIGSATWTATYLGAGSGGPASGSGDLTQATTTFDLAVGGTATFEIAARVRSTATGSLVNTVSVNVPSGTTNRNPVTTATDTDTPTPLADLRAFKTDNTTQYVPGTTTTYTITISNFGPSAVSGARVIDTFDSTRFDVANVQWTAVFPGGATRSGSGTIDELIDLDRGNAEAVVVFTVVAPILASATGELVNEASVMPPEGTTDYNLTNNSSTDVDLPTSNVTGSLVTGTDDGCGSGPLVRLLDPANGSVRSQFFAYEPSFKGGVRVATGDLDGDGFDEILTAPGRSRSGEVKAWTQAGAALGSYSFFPFGSRYTGGVEIAAADVDGDGDDDIIASMSSGQGIVRVFLVAPGEPKPVVEPAIVSFRPFAGKYKGGATVTAADLGSFDGGKWTNEPDGRADVIAGSNAGMQATVKVYDVTAGPRLVSSFNPIATAGKRFTGGVTLSTVNFSSTTIPDILVGAGIGGGSVVEVYSGSTFTRTARITAFSSFARPNATVFAAGLDADGDGLIDRLYAVQGKQGEKGTRGITAWDRVTGQTSLLPDSSGFLPPLRITSMKRRRLP